MKKETKETKETKEMDKLQATLAKQQSDLISKVKSLDLPKEDRKKAMLYLKKGEKMAANIYEDPEKLENLTNELSKVDSTEDVIEVLAGIFKKEFIADIGSDANNQLNAFCKAFDNKQVQEKLKEYDKDTRNSLSQIIKVFSSS